MAQSHLGAALDLIGRSEPPMACCPRDGAPLIATFVFRYKEFYCLECGSKLGFLSPDAKPDTPELKARYQELQAEWDEHAQGLIIEGREASATPEALAAHEAALAWLKERANR